MAEEFSGRALRIAIPTQGGEMNLTPNSWGNNEYFWHAES
jgi:hypothetical protein